MAASPPDPRNSGLFCIVEGIDGSGKSTLLAHLSAALGETGLVQMFGDRFTGLRELREPTGGIVGRRIRQHLQAGDQLQAAEWLTLFFVDRAENVRDNIRPALAAGELIIQDRYFYSTAAYQGETPEHARRIVADSFAADFPEPGVVLYLDITPDIAMQRIQHRAGQHAEQNAQATQSSVKQNSPAALESFETFEQLRRIHANYNHVLPAHTLRLDAEQSPAQLCEIALAHLQTAAR